MVDNDDIFYRVISNVSLIIILLFSKGITDEFDDDDDILYGANDKDDADIHHPFNVVDRAVPNPFTRDTGVSAEKLNPGMHNSTLIINLGT